MPRYIIHIGPPKAGSTYLQTSTGKMAPEMAEAGILVALRGVAGSGRLKAQDFLAALRTGNVPEVTQAFGEWNSSQQYHTIIISSEALHSMPEEQVVRLHDLTGAGNPVQRSRIAGTRSEPRHHHSD